MEKSSKTIYNIDFVEGKKLTNINPDAGQRIIIGKKRNLYSW